MIMVVIKMWLFYLDDMHVHTMFVLVTHIPLYQQG